MTRKSLTILICTRNGARTLARCLESCALAVDSVHADIVEIILADNGSTDATLRIADQAAMHSRCAFRILSVPTAGKTKAFIKGVREAAAELVCVIDDDNVIADDFLSRTLTFFNDYPEVGLVGSSNALHPDLVPPEWFLWAKPYYACSDPFLYEQVCTDSKGRVTSASGYVAGAGMSFRKPPLLDALNAGYSFFNDTIHGVTVTGEDIELCMLLRSLGYRFGFDPGLRLQHLVAPSRLTEEAFWELCQKVGAGSLGSDPFLFTDKTRSPYSPFKCTWQWQWLSKLRQLISLRFTFGSDGSSTSLLEREFQRKREAMVTWGALRRVTRERHLYSRHIANVMRGSWTSMRVR